MKIFLTVLLFIPSLSWGNVEKYYCKNEGMLTATGMSKHEDPSKVPYIYYFELNHTNKTFKKGDTVSYTKDGDIYEATGFPEPVDPDVKFVFNSKTNKMYHYMDIGVIYWYCITEPEYQIFLKQKEPSYKIDQCLDLGFKKGTEGLKNCVLELS